MIHIAILKKGKVTSGDNLLQNILDGTKTIESRWYVNKIAPWGKIEIGDVVYFKESGKQINAKAEVKKVLQFENFDDCLINEIIEKYGNKIAPNTSKKEWQSWARTLDKKKYCILVFIKNATSITPFTIDKKGFGMSCAWMSGVKLPAKS